MVVMRSNEDIVAFCLITLLAVLVALGLYAERVRLCKKRARFSDREELSLDEIYHRYYSDSGLLAGSVCEVWTQIAARLNVAPGLLRPSDRFDTQLSPVRGFPIEDELSDVEEYIRGRLARGTGDMDSLKLATLDNVIHLIAQHTQTGTDYSSDKGSV